MMKEYSTILLLSAWWDAVDACSGSYESLEGGRPVTVAVWSALSNAVNAQSWKVGTQVTGDAMHEYFVICGLWNLRVYSAVNTQSQL